MSKDEFIARWLARYGGTVEDLAKLRISAYPCNCGEDGCQGWAMFGTENAPEEAAVKAEVG